MPCSQLKQTKSKIWGKILKVHYQECGCYFSYTFPCCGPELQNDGAVVAEVKCKKQVESMHQW